MANDLTGDFDVVVEFSVTAADRVLAAMHANERFLHSLSLRVDDNPPPGSKFPRPSIGGSTDVFGDPVVNHKKIGLSNSLPAQPTASNPLFWVRGNTVVNPNLGDATVSPVVPSHLQGRAQLQLSPPMIEVPDASGTNVRLRMEVMSRYFPDPQTSPAVEFVHGELLIVAPVSQFASNAARMVEIDIKSDQVITNFNPLWTNRLLSPEDLAGINLLIRNAIKTGFLPSSTPLPDKVTHLQFKTVVAGDQNAIAVLLNMVPLSGTAGSSSPPGHPGTVSRAFLGAGDDFAFAVGRDYVQAAFPNVTDHRFPKIWIYSISVTGPKVEFQAGQPGLILLTFKGDAHTDESLPFIPHDIGFTVQQALALNLVASTPGGPLDTAQLVPVGDVSIHVDGLPDWASGLFTGSARDSLRARRDAQLANINPTIRDTLDVNTNLGQFLRSLLVPGSDGTVRDHRGMTIELAYISPEIQASGIVLHGSLSVPQWLPAHVEYEEIPVSGGPGRAVVGANGSVLWEGTDYSALKTWIPGGLIQQYEWFHQGQAGQPYIDVNRFVLLHSPPQASAGPPSAAAASVFIPPGIDSSGVVSAFSPMCLTVRGWRVPTSGSGPMQSVSATMCGHSSFPVVNASVAAIQGEAPLIAVTQPGPQGLVQVVGHTEAQVDRVGSGIPNLVIHFADDKTAGGLGFLTQALRASGRKDAAKGAIAVLNPEQLARAPYVRDIIYGENHSGAWERAYDVSSLRRPFTLIADPKQRVVWSHEGELDAAELMAAIREHLVPGGATSVSIPRLGLREGTAPPDLLLEYAPDRHTTLGKLKGRPVTLIFCSSKSKQSLDALRDLQRGRETSAGLGSLVLAIMDRETPDTVQKTAAESGLPLILVPDPNRAIAVAYGVTLRPTVVIVSPQGLVQQVRYGYAAAGPAASPGARSAAG